MILLGVEAALAGPAEAQSRRELNIIPIAGGDSDVGIGVGEVSDLASISTSPAPATALPSTASALAPYRWRLESGAFITFKEQDGSLILPYQDYFLLLSVPDLGASRRWRIDLRGSFTDETTLKYYGVGDATPPPPPGLDVAATEYKRIHPTGLVQVRTRLRPKWFLDFGSQFTYNKLDVGAGSVLASQRATGSPEVQGLLGDFGRHGVELLEASLQYDSRDNEIVTRRGMFHSLGARLSPRIEGWLPYGYLQLDATACFYATPVPRWLTVSFRAVADALVGSPPFYELARFAETPAIGGGQAVRGVPAQRYYGKVKVFENLELRSELFPFHLRSKSFVLGTALFLDGGRSWTELLHAHPELDGTGWGIKYGVGGGLRLQEGTTFAVRADVAWSPDASPVGAYFAAGEIF